MFVLACFVREPFASAEDVAEVLRVPVDIVYLRTSVPVDVTT